MANGTLRFPRNLGDPAISSATSRPETPGYQLQAQAAHSSAWERNIECNRGIAKRRKRSAARWAAGSHSVLIVPLKLANLHPLGASGGKRDVESWNRFWETRRMPRNSEDVFTKQERIAALAKQSPEMAFTSLAYLMDIDWLKEAYRRTRKDGAAGVDGVTAEEYEQDLEGNLQSLLDRAKSGTYKAPPVRRVHIPKGGSTTETRPLGIPDSGGQNPPAGGSHAIGTDL